MPRTSRKPAPAGTAGGAAASRRSSAKAGMTLSLGLLLLTAFAGARKRSLSRAVHLAAGAALLGFSLWRHCLYPPRDGRKEKA